MRNDGYLNKNKCWDDLSGIKRYTEGDAFLRTFEYISSECFQSVVCIGCLHLLLKANFCEKEIFCIVGTLENVFRNCYAVIRIVFTSE